MNAKSAIGSKTIWFNVLSFILALLVYLGNVFPNGDVNALILAVISIVNILLRIFTTQPINKIM